MPPSKPKPSEIASEAKKSYTPYIQQSYSEQWPQISWLCHSESMVAGTPPRTDTGENLYHARFAFYERDPVDLAIEWGHGEKPPIPVIMPAHDKRPGGDWETGVMSAEECLCRRSTLVAALKTPHPQNHNPSTNYPIPAKAGIYSPTVVVFRNGPEKYEIWPEYKSLPVISVAPVKKPRLTGGRYSFPEEKQMMKDKLRAALRIAVYYGHTNICIGAFGLGAGFENPPEQVAAMWRDLLLKDPEFVGHFNDIVFAFEAVEGSGASGSSSSSRHSSSSKSSKSKHSSSSSRSFASELAIFEKAFRPATIHAAYSSSKHSSQWSNAREVMGS